MSDDQEEDDIYIHTDLETAIIQGDKERCDSLIDDADLQHRSDSGSNLLHKAAFSGETEIASDLIERGVDIDAQDNEGSTPLHKALNIENYELAKLLVESGADLNIEDVHGNQPLWRAVFKANYELTELLLEHGADPTHENNVGESPLSIAQDADAEKFIQLLDPDSQ
ncbi:ankyrin repeat domain-containing protein [Haloferax sp. S1W]|uniref:ankyrin repeat domain-containing protein n=1 Tax=Haloferax sp. S1W TaxID=3377110 RepID=UPI0037CBF12A